MTVLLGLRFWILSKALVVIIAGLVRLAGLLRLAEPMDEIKPPLGVAQKEGSLELRVALADGT